MRSIIILALATVMFSCNSETAAEDNTEQMTTETAEVVSVPEVVKLAFAKAQPNATDVEWEIEGDKYEVEFELGEMDMVIIYNADGTQYATEEEMAVSALPEAVANAAGTNGEAKEASKITLTDGTIQYEVGIGDKDYTYNADGTLIGEEVDADSNDDDDDDDDEHEGHDHD
ncbi:MAG: hypothetical protein R2800_08615 [Flavipsychrobacter sp.]